MIDILPLIHDLYLICYVTRAKDEQLRAKDAELRAKDAELAKLQDNYAALKALEGAVSAMATKLDTAIQVFF